MIDKDMRSPCGLWLMTKGGQLEMRATPVARPKANEIVVRNRAVAVNPNDWLIQPIGGLVYPWLKYPFILGTDVAGTVQEVGADVTRFKVGDRILGNAVGGDKSRNDPAEGAFQDLTVLLEHMAAPIPDDMDFEEAAVLPLGASTAACGLFQKDHLALQFPSAEPKLTGKTVLVWGGSTSVGSNAIQLAVAAGYEVITTASPKNFDYVRDLGAALVFDHASNTAVEEIITAFEGRSGAGAIALGPGSARSCLAVVSAYEGNKFVSMATPPVSFVGAPSKGPRTLWLASIVVRLIASNITMMISARTKGVRMKFIFGTTLMANEVGAMLYESFLPSALAEKRYQAAPPPLVVGRGLGAIPAAIERQKRGVSAKKIVVTL